MLKSVQQTVGYNIALVLDNGTSLDKLRRDFLVKDVPDLTRDSVKEASIQNSI